MPIEFDVDAALKALQSGQDLNGPKGILIPLIKQLTEAELEQHIEQDALPNRKSGHTCKTQNPLLAALSCQRHGIDLARLSRSWSAKTKRI